MLKPMRFPVILSGLSGLLLAGALHAEPPKAPDASGPFLEEIAVVQQLELVGQSVTTKATELVGTALTFLGVPYRYGGTSAETGFDCSGYVKTVFDKTIGLALPRVAAQQAAITQKIKRTELRPGDLVFFNTMRRAFSHVGIYIGEGKFVHSPKPGAEVRVESLGTSYWNRRFDGARRVDVDLSQAAIKPVASMAPEAEVQARGLAEPALR